MHTVTTNNLSLTLVKGGLGVHLKYKNHAKFFIEFNKYAPDVNKAIYFMDAYSKIVNEFKLKLREWGETNNTLEVQYKEEFEAIARFVADLSAFNEVDTSAIATIKNHHLYRFEKEGIYYRKYNKKTNEEEGLFQLLISANTCSNVDQTSVVEGICRLDTSNVINSRLKNSVVLNSTVSDSKVGGSVISSSMLVDNCAVKYSVVIESTVIDKRVATSLFRAADSAAIEALPKNITECLQVRDFYPRTTITGLPYPLDCISIYANIDSCEDVIKPVIQKVIAPDFKLQAKDRIAIFLGHAGMSKDKVEKVLDVIEAAKVTIDFITNDKENREAYKTKLINSPVFSTPDTMCHPATFVDEALADRVEAILLTHPIYNEAIITEYN
nr:MAG TPA: hypothetical protein [Caudoviricetes sp.]